MIAGGAVSLDLIDPVERDVETIAAFVFDHRDFNGALPNKDRLQPAIDPDAVLEVDNEIPGLERGDRLECGARRIPTRASQASFAAEDLVIGENSEPLAGVRNRESGVNL